MLFAEITVVERYEHDTRRDDVADLRGRDHGPATRDDSHPIAIEYAESVGVGLVHRDEDLRRGIVELWCLTCLRPAMPVVHLPSADGDDRELVVGGVERRLVLRCNEYGAAARIPLLAIFVERVLVARLEILLVRFGDLPFGRKVRDRVEPDRAVWVLAIARPLDAAALGKFLVRHARVVGNAAARDLA